MLGRLLPLVLAGLTAVAVASAQAAQASADAKPSVTVFPVDVTPHHFSDDMAKRVGILVATFLERAGLEELEVADARFDPPATDDVNAIAAAFGKHVAGRPLGTAYAAYADFGVLGAKVDHVHVIVCDRPGEWVVVDMQNSHHADFRTIDPKSAADCNRLLVARLKGISD